jgi:adenylate kinase family enzyme
MTRVVVIGMSGSGKSTLARELARRLDAAHIELDSLFWGPDWEPRPPADFRAAAQAAVAQERWVSDGNYSAVRSIVWPRAQVVVWLNLPFAPVFWRVLCRTLRRAFSKEPLWSGNRESLARAFFSRESILWWVIRNHARRRRDFAALRAGGQFGHLQWIEFTRSPRAQDILDVIEGLPSTRSPVPT